MTGTEKRENTPTKITSMSKVSENAKQSGNRKKSAKGTHRKGGRSASNKSARRKREKSVPKRLLLDPLFEPAKLDALTQNDIFERTHHLKIKSLDADFAYFEVGSQKVKVAIGECELQLPEKPTQGDTLWVRLGSAQNDSECIVGSALDGSREAFLSQVQDWNPSSVEGVFLGRVKGGYSLALGAKNSDRIEDENFVRAFVPQRHALVGRHQSAPPMLDGEKDTFEIIEGELNSDNVVASRSKKLKAELKAKQDSFWNDTKVGDVVSARVVNVVRYGAFLDVGGVQGLLHQDDLSWAQRTPVRSVVREGQELEVKILELDRESDRCRFGLKQMTPDPWEEVRALLKPGVQLSGKVVSLADYGAFVELVPGVEGLVHISQMAWEKLKHPSQKVGIGDEVKVEVLELASDDRRIALSIKACTQNPWAHLLEEFPKGTIVDAEVKSLTEFGAFVSLSESVDGLIHLSEFSWTERYDHPRDLLTVGQRVEVVVLDIDVEKERVACSIKQTQADPWKSWEEKYQPGTRHTLKVSQVVDAGANFEVEGALNAWCRKRDLSDDEVGRTSDVVKVGSELEVVILGFDRRKSQLNVSARKVAEDEIRQAYKQYKAEEGDASAGFTLGDALQGKLSLNNDSDS